MANKNLQRKKPGYTKSGEVKIVSLSYKQLHELLEKTNKKKTQAKIRQRMNNLAQRKGFVNTVKQVTEETQPV